MRRMKETHCLKSPRPDWHALLNRPCDCGIYHGDQDRIARSKRYTMLATYANLSAPKCLVSPFLPRTHFCPQRLYFVKACGDGDIDRLQLRLDHGEDIESTDLQGNTGMHVAAAASNISVMAFLLDNRADKESRNKNVRSDARQSHQARAQGAATMREIFGLFFCGLVSSLSAWFATFSALREVGSTRHSCANGKSRRR